MLGRGQHKGSTSAQGEQSWRSLSGGSQKKRVQSPQARKRKQIRWFKIVGALLLSCLIFGGVVWAVIALKNREVPIQVTTPSKPVERLIFDTDGVLPDEWLGTVIELRRGLTLMEVDIHDMKQRLEAHGQVRSASVERVFPDALRIRVRESEPVLRMRVAGPGGQSELRIVARDGTIYTGVGYPQATLRRMPFVVPHVHPDGKIRPMRGIDRVAELLEDARRTQPNFYRTWQIVSLKHYTGDPDLPGQVIEVQSSIVPRIIFGLSTDFAQQLDRLSVILNYVQSRGNPAIKRIDLSLRESAAVQFESGRISTF
ncbi:MAG: FtsQ-type POTRA domain-containing protein [Puniceicoccaceae bacterium]|nr:MAG: FtsQ-type POTRA domain-containing protein [Puniceicoccaceae bacterium]